MLPRSPAFSAAKVFCRVCMTLLLSTFVATFTPGEAALAAEQQLDPSPTGVEACVNPLETEQRERLEAVQKQFNALPHLPEFKPGEPDPIASERRLRAQLADMLQEIERRVQDESASSSYRSYYDRLCRRIEARAIKNLPMAEGKSVQGRVVFRLTISKAGRLQDIKILSATSEVLRRHAVHLLRRLAPYEPFPTDISKEVDSMVITTSMNYLRSGE